LFNIARINPSVVRVDEHKTCSVSRHLTSLLFPMSELSPAARAVLTAVTLKRYDVPPEGLPAFAEEMAPLLAAALRAAVEQVLPHEALKGCDPAAWERDEMRVQLLAIASELESL
jgi:hypothetical protein